MPPPGSCSQHPRDEAAGGLGAAPCWSRAWKGSLEQAPCPRGGLCVLGKDSGLDLALDSFSAASHVTLLCLCLDLFILRTFLGPSFLFFLLFFFSPFFFPSFFFLLFFSIPVPGTENRGQISQTALPPSFSTELCCSQGGNAARKEPFGERPSAPGTCCFLEFINYFLPVPSDLGIHSLGSKGFWDRGREEWVHPGAWAAVGSQRWFLFGLGVWEKLLGETKNGFSQPSQHSIPSFCLDSCLESSVDLLVLLSPSQSPLLQICLAQTQKVLA